MPHMLCFDYHCTPTLIARVTNLLVSSRARLATSSKDTHGCSSVIRMTVSDVQRVNDGRHQQREAHAPCLHTHTKVTPAATTTTLHPLPHPTPPASRPSSSYCSGKDPAAAVILFAIVVPAPPPIPPLPLYGAQYGTVG